MIHLEKECLRAGLGSPLLDPRPNLQGKHTVRRAWLISWSRKDPEAAFGLRMPGCGPLTLSGSSAVAWKACEKETLKSVLYDTFLMWSEHMQRFACIINSFLVTLCRFSGCFADVNSQFSLHLCMIFLIDGWANIKRGNDFSEIAKLVQ